MEDSSAAASSETLATTTTGNMSLLEVQSEQLAIKLQQEAYGGHGAANGADGDAGVKDDASGAGRQQWPISAAQDSSSFSETPNTSQGAWGVPGRSAADLLRSANASSAAATPTSSQEQLSSPPAHAAAARSSSSSSAAAAADLAVVPLSAESIGALVGMGIDQAWAAAAMRRCGGNDVSRAVEYCFSHDMEALAKEDARAFEVATTAGASQQQQQQSQENETQHQQPDADSDMAFALAIEQGTFGSKMNVDIGIEELLALETELKTERESATSSVSLDAKLNILKYLQVQTVRDYQAVYDALYHELNKEGGLECLRNIAPVRTKDLCQPKVLEAQDCGENDQVEKQLEFYLANAEHAKLCLDELVKKVAEDSRKCEVQYVEVKSPESTRRKAIKFYGGDVRKVADMARVTVICETPEALAQALFKITALLQPKDVLRVKNGFNSDWTPGGYRDVKVNAVVNEHLCEIQLQLRDFFALKSGQHAVYRWARELNVTTEINAHYLFQNVSPAVTEEMIRLAGQDWHRTRHVLPDLYLAAGRYDLAVEGRRQTLLKAEKRDVQDIGGQEWRQDLFAESEASLRLGLVLDKQGKYEEVKQLCTRSLAVREKCQGPDHPGVAAALNNLALSMVRQGKYDEAKPLYKGSLAVMEKAVGHDHPEVALVLNNLAMLLQSQGKYEEAKLLLTRSLAIDEKVLGPEHPEVAESLGNLADLVRSQGNYEEATPLYQRSLDILEKARGPYHPDVARGLNNFALFLQSQGNNEQAKPLYNRVVAIHEKMLGPDHPDVAKGLNNLAFLLKSQGKYEEAKPLYKRSLAIREKVLGPDHLEVAEGLNNLSGLLLSQDNYDEAKTLNQRSLVIREKALGPDHPSLATGLNNWAFLSHLQGKYAEAAPLYERATEIWENALGPDHPTVATVLNSRAHILYRQGSHDKAIELLERVTAIRTKKLGKYHQDTIDAMEIMDHVRRTRANAGSIPWYCYTAAGALLTALFLRR